MCSWERFKQILALILIYMEMDYIQLTIKISANYGKVELATSINSNGVDLFGTAVNICSKINHPSLPNEIMI